MKRILAFFGTSIVLVAQLLLVAPVHAATTISITSPTSGSSETGTSFTVTGTATADRLITVEVDGTEVGTTTSDGSGDWSLEVTGQDAGAKTITATASVQYAYVANGNAATMSVINTITDEVVNTVTTGVNQNGSVAVSPDGSQAVSVSGYGGDNTVKVYSLADPEAPVITNNLTVPDTYAISAKYSPDGAYFVVNSAQNDFSSSTVTRYTSASPGTSSAVIGFDQVFPAGLSYNSSGSTLYVSNVISGSISVIDTATNTQTSTFSTGGATFAGNFVLSSDDTNGYLSANNQDAAIPVDVGGPSAGTPITVGDSPQDLIYNSDESRLFIANGTGGSVSSINTANNTVVDTVATGTQPRFFAKNSDYSKLYLGLSGDDTVAILNPSTLATTGTITVGDQPAGIAVGAVESASDSTSFTLAATASASDEALADTGQNTYLYLVLASSLLIAPAVYLRKRYTSNKRRVEKKMNKKILSLLSLAIIVGFYLLNPLMASAAPITDTNNATGWQAPASPFMTQIQAATVAPAESMAYRDAPGTLFNVGENSNEPTGGSNNETGYIPLSLSKICPDDTAVEVTVGAYARSLTTVDPDPGSDSYTIVSGIIDISPFGISGVEMDDRTTVGAYASTTENVYSTTAGNISNVAAFVNAEVVTYNGGHYQGSMTVGLPEITLAYDDAECTLPPTANDSTETVTSSSTEQGKVIVNGTSLGADDPDGDTLSYSITAGNGAGYFAIDSSSGDISSTQSNVPAGTYTLTVLIDDGNGGTVEVTVTITVTDSGEVLADTGGNIYVYLAMASGLLLVPVFIAKKYYS